MSSEDPKSAENSATPEPTPVPANPDAATPTNASAASTAETPAPPPVLMNETPANTTVENANAPVVEPPPVLATPPTENSAPAAVATVPPAAPAGIATVYPKPLPPMPEKRGLNVPLALVALFLIGFCVWLFMSDLKKLRDDKGGVAQIQKDAIEKTKELEDPANGWFPAMRDPIFSWDQDEQGWVYEADSPAPTLTSVASKTPPDATPSVAKPASVALKTVKAPGENRGNALQVPVHFPDPATVLRDASKGPEDPYKLVGIRFISYDVFLPKDCPGFVGCLFFLKDKDGLWFQARTRAALVPGEWSTVMADIRGDSPDVTPLGHLGQWDDNQATKVRMIGLTFYGDKKWDGNVLIDNLRGWMRPQRFKNMVDQLKGGAEIAPVAPARMEKLNELVKKVDAYKEEPVQVINLRTEPAAVSDENGPSSPPMVRKFDTLTLRFELNRQVDNPFDPEKADVTCIVENKASGKKTEHIGFWFQDYDRADHFDEDELKPMGRPEWRVRITPREEGEYTYKLRVKLKSTSTKPGEPPYETLELPPRPFFAMPSEGKGFIKVSKKDSRFFEFENGDFYYPIGHNVSSPVDIRCWKLVFNQDPPAGRGLPMYMDFFDKMEKNGENMAEVWMASWWLGIEWTSRWRDYYGAGRYSMQHAWKLDYVLELARKKGIYVHLVIDNHGKFSNWCDWEFQDCPYNRNSAGDAGVVNNSEEFFTDPTCRKWHRNKLRYIAARWGSDPAVFGWELCSEFDLVGGTSQYATQGGNGHPRQYFHRSPTLKTWAREMIGHLRQCDPYDHPVTNHYATDTRWVDVDLAREPAGDGQPLFDYVATDVYRRPDKRYMVSAMENQQWFNLNLKGEARKPFWITEYGGDFNAAPMDYLISDVHCGMWSTWLTEGAGTPLFWWYDVVDVNNLYPYYKAFAAYTKGEDRRGLSGTTAPLTLTSSTSGAVLGYSYRWPTGAYAWVYNDAAMRSMPPEGERPHQEGIEAVIPELAPGKYRVEYWNCYTGAVDKTEDVDVTKHSLHLAFPPFVNDMAVKVKKIDGAAAAVPPAKVPDALAPSTPAVKEPVVNRAQPAAPEGPAAVPVKPPKPPKKFN